MFGFNDGAEDEVDLAEVLDGEVFGPLRDIGMFKTARVYLILASIGCANGADPESKFLHENLKIVI